MTREQVICKAHNVSERPTDLRQRITQNMTVWTATINSYRTGQISTPIEPTAQPITEIFGVISLTRLTSPCCNIQYA